MSFEDIPPARIIQLLSVVIYICVLAFYFDAVRPFPISQVVEEMLFNLRQYGVRWAS